MSLAPGWAVVTGGSSGIGAAFATELGRLGHPVALVGRSPERLELVADRIGTQVRTFAVDLAVDELPTALADLTSGAGGPVAVLVNCAGTGTFGPFAEQDPGSVAETVGVNLTSVVRLTRAALPGMIARGGGGILNVSSSASDMPAPGAAVYTASKAAVDSFSRSLRRELRGHGIVVTCVRPGYTRTAFHERTASDPGAAAAGRWCEPGDVVDAALRAHRAGRAVVTVPRPGAREWARRHGGDLGERIPASWKPVLRRAGIT